MKKLKTFLNILLALVFVFSAVMMVLQALDNSGGESEYREAAEIAMGTGTEAAAETTRGNCGGNHPCHQVRRGADLGPRGSE